MSQSLDNGAHIEAWEKLQQVYEGLLVGDVDLERLNRILADFEDLLTAAETVEAL